jgi:uncharacterized NAD(P)/FAD-binding protein YdhS
MSDAPESFLQWLDLKPGCVVRSDDFISRGLYGEYLEDTLFQILRQQRTTVLTWIYENATTIGILEGFPFVVLESGTQLKAKTVVLATGNAPPSSPTEVEAIAKRFYSPYAWSLDALDGIPDRGTVLILGSGLTAVDQILALRSRGFRGCIFMLSRRGQLPAVHSSSLTWPSDWTAVLPNTVCGVFRALRQQIDIASAEGANWRAVIDSLRPASADIWRRWPVAERKRFLRHLRTYWEISRHRVPQTTYDALMTLIADDHLRLISGRLIRVSEAVGHVDVVLCERKNNSVQTLSVDRIINCTGSATVQRVKDQLLLNLLRAGLARPDALEISVDVGIDGSLLSRSGQPSNCIFTIGPVRKGSNWETTAIAEIREQAAQLAHILVKRLSRER